MCSSTDILKFDALPSGTTTPHLVELTQFGNDSIDRRAHDCSSDTPVH
jgi:hypothetical protein